jgi:hypothetical protein
MLDVLFGGWGFLDVLYKGFEINILQFFIKQFDFFQFFNFKILVLKPPDPGLDPDQY